MTEGKPDLAATLRHYGVDVAEHRMSQLVCCPVHEESRPSCSVSLTKQVWSCKACSAAGDAYTLIQIKEGFDSFAQVVQFASDRLGLERPADRAGRRGLGGDARRSSGYRPGFRRKRLAG